MTVYIDPPLWAAHGTTFSHLVSDVALSELHDFALSSGVHWRAFDLDHFDIPADRYDGLVARGARPVSANQLTRILIESGLRLPRHERGGALERRLLDQWDKLLPGQPGIGEELVGYWREPGRYYHDERHLFAVLENIDLLEPPLEGVGTIKLAAWFHDAVYRGAPGEPGDSSDEQASADLARARLTDAGVSADEVAEVERLILMTATHDPKPAESSGHILSDADLAILASPWPAYERYLIGVRSEYAQVPDTDFALGRAEVVQSLRALPQLFHTETGRLLWEAPAQNNLERELDLYTNGLTPWLHRNAETTR